ncbi:hypothetical protein [Halobacterium sp. R2-5]|uniref:hypothetical protein n=1 Tax=Halobacterium sp. R2-5 TaxID=2715751 RepID=UPI0014249279|nr:hypothetical protein [Halobacterium sp. R2-5]
MTDLELVAFDIETTGFTVEDEVTVVGFVVPLGCRVFCQTGGRSAPDLETWVREQVGEHVVVSTHESEAGLLEAVGEFAGERFRDSEVLLVAYNGERWKAGFDLPFLRTRLAATDVVWPFEDVPYADLLPVVTNRFNTTVDADETVGDLVNVYEVLCDGEYSGLDPFEDSQEAVTAYEDGQFEELVLHNVADILRTRSLGRLAERYCSKSDFKLKSLTPTIHD